MDINSPKQPSPPNPVYEHPAMVATSPLAAPAAPANNQPAQVFGTPAPAQHQATSAGLVVLQWLTYAFWGWTVLALSFLTSTVIGSFMNNNDLGSSIAPYTIAAVIVLLPISVICDVFYSKHEPDKKTGAAMVVMVIHAVFFAFFGIGSLIAVAFCLVGLFTDSSQHTSTLVALYSAMIIAVFYAVTFLRTLHPAKFSWIKRVYSIFMVVFVGVIAILGFVGPVAKAHQTKDDKLIESGLSSVTTAVTNYATTNSKLPDNLQTLTLDGDAKTLVNRNLIRYTANTPPVTQSTNSLQSALQAKTNPGVSLNSSSYLNQSQIPTVYYYTFCVTYKKKSSFYNTTPNYSNSLQGDGYTTSPDSYSHPAGEVCYKLKTGY